MFVKSRMQIPACGSNAARIGGERL